MKRSELKEIIREVIKEYYDLKVNKGKETITFVNDADVRKAIVQLKKQKVQFIRPALQPKTLKFVNTHAFKEAQKIIGEHK